MPVEVNVADVFRADFEDAYFQMYQSLAYLQNNGLIANHANLITEHYAKQVKLYFPFSYWEGAVSVTRDASNQMQVDWTGFDSRVQPAFNAGLTEVAIAVKPGEDGWYRDDWFDDPSVDVSDSADTDEFGYLLAEHLLGLGFRGPFTSNPETILVYAYDELAIPDLQAPATIAHLERIGNLHPAYRTHITINHYDAGVMNLIDTVLDVYMMADRTCQTFIEDIASGDVTIDADNEIGFYDQVRYFNTPDAMRRLGWRAAYLNVNNFCVFAYEASANDPEWKIYVSKGGDPLTTPALEGLSDGFEDFGYWRKYSLLIEEIAALPQGSLDSAQQQLYSEAVAFRGQVFNGTSGLIPLATVDGWYGARDWQDIQYPDRWDFRSVKQQLFTHILNMNAILGY